MIHFFQLMGFCCFGVVANACRRMFLLSTTACDQMTWFALGIITACVAISCFAGMLV